MSMIIFVGLTAMFLLGGDATESSSRALTSQYDIVDLGRMILEDDFGDIYLKQKMMNQSALRSVITWSKLYKEFGSHANSGMHRMLNLFLDKHEISNDLQNRKTSLLDSFNTINQLYHDSLEYMTDKTFDNTTKLNFTERVLSGPNNLSNSLAEIYDEFSSQRPGGFFSLLEQRIKQHLPTDCGKAVSSQQLFYFVYIQLIITELTGLATLKHVCTIKASILGQAQICMEEKLELKSSFDMRVKEYHSIFNQVMSSLPQHLYKCHVNVPKRGVDFLELQKFSQIKFLERDSREKNCSSCPHRLMIREMARREGTEMYNCQTFNQIVEVCPAETGSSRSYLWWKDDDGIYGHHTPCPDRKTITAGWYNSSVNALNVPIMKPCATCACSVDQKWGLRYDHLEIAQFGAVAQKSNIPHNMVVTGIRFVEFDNAISLQIQESQFAGLEMIHHNTSWKRLDINYDDNGRVAVQPITLRHRVTPSRKTMYLDDIIVPDSYAVTGVQIIEIDTNAFGLRIHATKLNFVTGELDPSQSVWCESIACHREGPSSDYKRERMEIKMNQPDDPTRGQQFDYDPETNKMIKFTHTDLFKDGGQTTIPFFDAQSLQSTPVFPLSGIGLYYRGKEGFGGYIAPRIFTLSISDVGSK